MQNMNYFINSLFVKFKTDFLKFRKPNCNLFDNFHYNYEALAINGLGQDVGSKNRLFQVTDAVAPSVKTDDFDSQVNADNYVYDKLGRIVEDKAKNIVQTYNKENKIITQTIGSKVITYRKYPDFETNASVDRYYSVMFLNFVEFIEMKEYPIVHYRN